MRAQHLKHLEIGNRRRMAMAAHKRRLRALPYKDGLLAAAALIREPDDDVGALRTRAVLESVIHVGAHKANSLLDRSGVPRPVGFERVRNLSPENRRRLVRELERRARS